MAGIYDLLPEGALSALGLNPNATNEGLQPTAQPVGLNAAMQPTQVPQQPQQQQQAPGGFDMQGILNSAGIKTDGLMGRFGNALLAAGSEDPAAAILQLNKARREQIDANKPKVTPLADGAFSLVTFPDGRTQIMKNDDVAQFLRDQETNKMANALAKIGYQGTVTQANQSAQVNNKTAGEARQALQASQALYDGWNKALGIVEGQAKDNPTMSKAQGLLPGVAGFFGGDQVASNKFLQGLKVDETLLNTARTKGAISNAEMELFASPIPALSDDREKVWKPYIEARLPVIKKLMEFQQAEAARGDQAPGANIPTPGGGKPAAAAPQPLDEAQVKSAGMAYDPGYEYAMVNGQLMKRKKGN